jgi:hypothetical protein
MTSAPPERIYIDPTKGYPNNLWSKSESDATGKTLLEYLSPSAVAKMLQEAREEFWIAGRDSVGQDGRENDTLEDYMSRRVPKSDTQNGGGK